MLSRSETHHNYTDDEGSSAITTFTSTSTKTCEKRLRLKSVVTIVSVPNSIKNRLKSNQKKKLRLKNVFSVVSLPNCTKSKVESKKKIQFSKHKDSEIESRHSLSSLWYQQERPKDRQGICEFNENWLSFPDNEESFPSLRSLSIMAIQKNFLTLKSDLKTIPFPLQWEVYYQSV